MAKSARVSAKKSAKAKSARRPTSAKAARGVAKTAKAPAKAVAKQAKTTAKAVRSIAEAMKAAKAARIEPIKARPIPNTIQSPAVQPYVPPVEIKTHKFDIGQVVYYNAPTFGRAPAPGNFTVVKLLPSEGDEQQYRIKSNGEAFERVAKESQLDIT
jgi:hypothetical protein